METIGPAQTWLGNNCWLNKRTEWKNSLMTVSSHQVTNIRILVKNRSVNLLRELRIRTCYGTQRGKNWPGSRIKLWVASIQAPQIWIHSFTDLTANCPPEWWDIIFMHSTDFYSSLLLPKGSSCTPGFFPLAAIGFAHCLCLVYQ